MSPTNPADDPGGSEPERTAEAGIFRVTVHLRVNGQPESAEVDTRTSLLDLLRGPLGLTGTKWGCNQGACGACTVLVDDERVLSCLTLAVKATGCSVRTIEGVGSVAQLHPLQSAFIANDAFQCGFCTAGQICSGLGMAAEAARGVPSAVTDDLLGEDVELSATEIRERMSGNLCRCGAHNGIVSAISEVYS